MFKRLLLLTSLICLSQAHGAGTNEAFVATGANATFAAAGALLTSSPLPSLDGGSLVITPLVGRITVEAHNDDADRLDELTPGTKTRYFGSAKGNNAALAVTWHSKGDWSFFVLGAGASLKGEYTQNVNDVEDKRLSDYEGQTIAGALGVQYRLIGTDDSPFALGLFAGPMYYASRSKAKYEQPSAGSGATNLTFNPSDVGALAGLQFVIRLGGFRINPYVKVAGAPGEMCKKVEMEGGPAAASDITCRGRPGYVFSPALTAGVGLLVGYKRLLFNVITSTDESNHLRPTSTNISVGIPL